MIITWNKKRDADAIKSPRARVDKAILKGRIARIGNRRSRMHTQITVVLLPRARERRKWAMERQARHLHRLVRSSGSIDHDPRRADHSCLPRVSYDTFAFSRLGLASSRGARNARDERYRDDALIIPKDWCAFDVKLLQHGLPFVQGKLRSWIREWIFFFILRYNCTPLSRRMSLNNVEYNCNIWYSQSQFQRHLL